LESISSTHGYFNGHGEANGGRANRGIEASELTDGATVAVKSPCRFSVKTHLRQFEKLDSGAILGPDEYFSPRENLKSRSPSAQELVTRSAFRSLRLSQNKCINIRSKLISLD
jgi:hypothetical protein